MTDRKNGNGATGISDDHNERGIRLADHGLRDEAIREFRKAIELDPDNAHAHDNLATVLAEKERYRESLEEYLHALRLEPDNPTAHYNLACFLATHGLDMAVDHFEESLALDPEYSDAHLNLGLAFADLGRIDDALREMRTAVELAPDDAYTRHELAALLMDELADYRAAIPHLKEVVRLEPEEYEGHLDLGICYAQKGFCDEALRCYQRSAELKPDDVLVAYNLAGLHAQWNKPEPSLEHLRRALALDAEKVRQWLGADTMFDELKGTPEFEAVLAAAPAPAAATEPARE